ncbi:hypothetical protein [Streptomyces cavernae]|uniref:hypothetical protein n=1 Tax=Streptomyces cavernae TaxID=2259034 RepID=UPI000FEC01AD|nr:hypothetical protein [Streptomyces cavernae]
MDTERPEKDEAATPPRRRSPLIVASVAAAVLVVGGGGAYFATTASSGGSGSGAPSADRTPPPLPLEGYGSDTQGTGSDGSNGIAVGEPDPNGTVYRADGPLPEGPDAAPVYRAQGEVTRAEVARLAKALGVTGTPRATDGAWRVGAAEDGSGPALTVSRKAPGTWTFSRYAPGEVPCESTTVCSQRTAPGEDGAIGEAAAKKAAAPLLKALGQDDAKLDAKQLMGAIRVVNADPLIGDLPTFGWTTGIQVAKNGQVIGGSGELKAPVQGDSYPVINARETLELLNRPGGGAGGPVGIGGCASPVPLKERDEPSCTAPTAEPKKTTVAVEGATFGLAVHMVDGRRTLVPSWLFEVTPAGAKESVTVTHAAVDPAFVTSPSDPGQPGEPGTSPTPAPTPTPTPRPGGPSGEPEGTPRDVQVEAYRVDDKDGKKLTVRYTAGVCSEYTASVSESADEVTVKVTERPWKENQVCIMIAKISYAKLTLDKPLGDRKVVGTDGKPVPSEKTLPKVPSGPQ